MGEHYFSADPSVPFKRVPVRANVWGRELELTSGSGVFAHGRLDIGTSILFRETEPPKAGTFLDLGCGYGVIGVALAAVVPDARVWAVDVNERAVLLANENAATLGVADRFTAVTPERLPAHVSFDEIWSNPPIRIGKPALHQLLLSWLPIWSNPPIRIGKPALHQLLLSWLPRLAAGGRAVMVVGKNLGADSLQRWLEGQGYPTVRLASAKGFRVLESRPSGRGTGSAQPLGQPRRQPPRRPAAARPPGDGPNRAG